MSSSSSTIVPSIATNCEDSSPVNIPYLPDELLLNCLARVSRLYYPTLFLVSKRFRSLLVSKELYKTRKLIGCTESCLYVCLVNELNPYWFILCWEPIQNPNSNPKPKLVSIPSHDYFPTYGWEVVADGSNIYMIGGSTYNDNDDDDDHPSSKVFIMDCRSHTWCEAPRMREARQIPSASVLDGKIYVAGGVEESNHICSKWLECFSECNLLECFDPEKQKWEHVECPRSGAGYIQSPWPEEHREVFKSLAIEGKLYLLGGHDKVEVYKPNENRWDALELETDKVFTREMEMAHNDCFCMIDNILYGCGRSKTLKWFDFEEGYWRVLKGVEELPKLSKLCDVRLVNYGGKLAVLWEEGVSELWRVNEKMIWCAEISLERCNEQEIYGKVEWCKIVDTIRKSCYMDKCIVVTV